MASANIDGYNRELVGRLDGLKKRKDEIVRRLQNEAIVAEQLEQEEATLTERLNSVNERLRGNTAAQEEVARLIQETENLCLRIVESSMTLLHVLQKEHSNWEVNMEAGLRTANEPTSSSK